MARLPRNEIQIFIPKDENSSRGKIFNFEAFSSKMLKLNNSLSPKKLALYLAVPSAALVIYLLWKGKKENEG